MKKNSSKPIYKQWWLWGAIILLGVIIFAVLNLDNVSNEPFDAQRSINVYTREEGSGTRTAFTEVTELVDENGDDAITLTATVQNSTNAITQAIARDTHGISYVSLGSLNDSVKGVAVDGVEPTAENIQSGEYTLYRNFNVVFGRELSEVAKDFWNFMVSAQAQGLVELDGFVPVESDAPEYEAKGLSGTISVVGSTSVEPTVQRFAEAYREYNPNVKIDITAPGSGAGITSAIDGTSDIGMSSREPSEEEFAQLIDVQPIATDGIVIIVNNNNPISSLTTNQIHGIYSEFYTIWDELLDN